MTEQLNLFGFDYQFSTNLNDYSVELIDCETAKKYIIKNHYSHGCHNAPSPCYGLFDKNYLVGVLMFATPCSEAVRESVFGKEYKDWVIELHRLHCLDGTPKNTESYFISKCLKNLKKDLPRIKAVISFSDTTQGHQGIVYQATHFYYCGKTTQATFYIDQNGRLRHPHQCGENITLEKAKAKGWKPVKRLSKNRYLYILGSSKTETKKLIKLCKYKLVKDKYPHGEKENY